ncbi:MAG TPA: SGNH/GDSL hydrolase family protein [Thermoleophilaceae bacterium]|jgi:lysophospholipase L1-like esterase
MLRRSAIAVAAVLAALAAAPPAGASLVALGDSFSSGEGAPPFEPGHCHRSPHAWPLVLAARLDAPGTSRACSGAVVADVVQDQIPRVAPGADVLTLTIGGNDLGFAEVLRRCVLADCVRHYARAGRDAIDARVRALRARLPALYRRVRSAAPGAGLVVLGYPRLFPRRPGRFTCAALGAISRAEALYLNAKTAAADRAIRAAARDAGALYVETLDAFDGGEVRCAPRRRYVNDLTFLRGGVISPYSFHPTAAGHARLAALALDGLAANVRDRR